MGENRAAALKIKWKWIARLNFNGASGTLMFTQVEIESLACPRSSLSLYLSIFPLYHTLPISGRQLSAQNHKSQVD